MTPMMNLLTAKIIIKALINIQIVFVLKFPTNLLQDTSTNGRNMEFCNSSLHSAIVSSIATKLNETKKLTSHPEFNTINQN